MEEGIRVLNTPLPNIDKMLINFPTKDSVDEFIWVLLNSNKDE